MRNAIAGPMDASVVEGGAEGVSCLSVRKAQLPHCLGAVVGLVHKHANYVSKEVRRSNIYKPF